MSHGVVGHDWCCFMLHVRVALRWCAVVTRGTRLSATRCNIESNSLGLWIAPGGHATLERCLLTANLHAAVCCAPPRHASRAADRQIETHAAEADVAAGVAYGAAGDGVAALHVGDVSSGLPQARRAHMPLVAAGMQHGAGDEQHLQQASAGRRVGGYEERQGAVEAAAAELALMHNTIHGLVWVCLPPALPCLAIVASLSPSPVTPCHLRRYTASRTPTIHCLLSTPLDAVIPPHPTSSPSFSIAPAPLPPITSVCHPCASSARGLAT